MMLDIWQFYRSERLYLLQITKEIIIIIAILVQVRPLMLDIWQFYRSERLYLLQITKEMLSSSLMTEEDSGDSEVALSISKNITNLSYFIPVFVSILIRNF